MPTVPRRLAAQRERERLEARRLRAAERDQAAIDRWVAERWPRIKQTPNGAEPAWSSSTSPRSA
jgi:hypothetical protein